MVIVPATGQKANDETVRRFWHFEPMRRGPLLARTCRAMIRLSKRSIDAAMPQARVVFLWDDQLRGFGLRIQPGGSKTFVIQYRTSAGRSRRIALGRYGVLTADQARWDAQQKLAAVARGEDPAGERRAMRDALTVRELFERYLSEHVCVHNAATTQAETRRLVNTQILPRLGGIRAGVVTRQDAARVHAAMRKTPRQANIVLSILSKAFNLAEIWGARSEHSNPARGIRRYAENSRERFLSEAEIARLGAVLEEAAARGLPWVTDEAKPVSKHLAKPENRRSSVNPQALAAIRLLLFTGARLSEIIALRWEHVDFERRTLALPSRKGAARVAHPVSAPVADEIAALSRSEGSPWVLPRASDRQRHISKEVMESAWQRVRAAAGFPDVRLHDLRHTVGTMVSRSGANAFLIRDVLRHKTLAMTGRYVNRDNDPVREAVDQVGESLSAGLRKRQFDYLPG